MLISDEYRQELLNYFPYLPKKGLCFYTISVFYKHIKKIDIFYQLLRQITDKVINSRNPFPELMTQIDYNNIGDDDNGYYKWKLAASILKRVDDIENDWTYSFIPQTSIYGLLECPVLQNSNCATQNWVDKSKYIPTIELPPPLHEISQETAHDKIQLDSTVLDRLTSFITVYGKCHHRLIYSLLHILLKR